MKPISAFDIHDGPSTAHNTRWSTSYRPNSSTPPSDVFRPPISAEPGAVRVSFREYRNNVADDGARFCHRCLIRGHIAKNCPYYLACAKCTNPPSEQGHTTRCHGKSMHAPTRWPTSSFQSMQINENISQKYQPNPVLFESPSGNTKIISQMMAQVSATDV